MKNKIVIIGIILIGVILISGSFNGGNDVTVNEVSFHLPDGFDVNNPKDSYSNETYENVVYKNNKTKNIVEFEVSNKWTEDSVIETNLIENGYEQQTIKGKKGYYKMILLTDDVSFVYIDNDKVINIIVPYLYDKWGDNSMSYDELLDKIIK